ncbi:MAG: glutathione S-transferase, partial [Acinetobacter sp.]|nr:glutathione S-transferase [Acinetobacter sp.]
LEIKGTPWEREEAEGVSEEWNNYQQNLLDLPLGQYVLRIYQTERNARVDWRGI